MFHVLSTRILPTLRRVSDGLRDVARAVLQGRDPDHQQGLWRPVALQPARVRIRRHPTRI
jgi:hypothetical protein